ncbi:MAG: chemotaxis protein CheW [bacterium]|nr:chemotaxis protein CheW [bacterium]MCS7308778.1 chemotaxis protein CheW [Armatimonadota bacterium]MDW8105837.1 chemotaxis protein CheW [Armatimonadota bacterium]
MHQSGDNLYVQAQVGGERVGFPVSAVREIIHVPSISRVPRAPRWLRGVAALRGQTIPILCLRERFGMEPTAPSPQMRVVIAEVHGQPVGFLVDGVYTVRRFAEEDIEPPTALLLNEQNGYIEAIGHDGDQLVLLLQPDALLDRKQVERLRQLERAA